MRIVVDVSPLSHPRTGIGNYIRGMLRGLVEAGAEDVVAFAPASERGARNIEASLNGVPIERRHPHAADRLRVARGVVGRAAPTPRARRRRLRRLPPLRLAARAAARRRSRADGLRPRAAALPRVVAPRARGGCTVGATARRGVRTSSSRSRSSRRRDVRERLGVDAARRVSRRGRALHARGRARAGRVRARDRDARAAQEPRRARRPWRARRRLRHGRAAAAALPRRLGVRLPVALRRVRHAGRRGDGVRHSRRLLEPSLAGRGGRRAPRSASTRRTRPRSARGIDEARRRRDELVPLGLAHAARFTWRATGEALLRGYQAAA